MALATLSIDLEARLARLEGDLGRAASSVERSSKKMASSFGFVDKQVKELKTTLVSAFAATAIVQGIQGIVTGLEKLVDISEVTGASIENISGLEDVARRTGTSIETVETSLVKLNAVLKEADGKNAQSQALKAIGLEAEALKRLDPAQALLQVSQALAVFADDGNKARIVQELFGKSVKEVGPLLKDLAAQGAINATVTADQARAAQQFSDSLSSLIKSLGDVGRAFAGPVLEGLNAWIERVKTASQVYGGFLNLLGAAINPFSSDVRNIVDGVASIELYTKSVKELATLEAVQEQNRKSASQAIVDRTQKDIEALKLKIAAFKALNKEAALSGLSQRDRLRLAEAQSARVGDFAGISVSGGGTTTKTGGGSRAKQISELEKYREKLEASIQSAKDLSAAEEFEAAVARGAFVGSKKEQVEAVRKLAQALDAQKQAKENDAAVTRQNQKVERDYNDEKEESLKNLKRLLEDTPTAQREALLRIEKLLTEEYEKQGGASGESSKKFIEALGIVKEKLEDIGKKSEETGEKMSTFAQRAAENIQDQLGDTLVRILDGDFKSIGRLWKQMLDRMVAEALAAKLLKAIFPDGVEKGLGKLFGAIFGGDTTIGDTDPFGTGFDPSTGGKFSGSIPGSSKSGFGSQKSSAVYNYNVAAGVSRSEVLSALQLVRDQARADTSIALRRAGVA